MSSDSNFEQSVFEPGANQQGHRTGSALAPLAVDPSLLYVLYVLHGPYIAHIVLARKYIAHIAHIARNPGRVDVQWVAL